MSTDHSLYANEISYQRPDIADVEKLCLFFKKSLTDNFAYFPKEACHYYEKSWEKEQITKRLTEQKELLFCAWVNNQIAGMVFGPMPEGGVGTVVWLMVDPAFQNRKIGATLLKMAKEYYRALNAHKLKLTVHNSRAVSFYQREGLVIEGEHINHWWGLNFWTMVCFLGCKDAAYTPTH